MDTLLEVSGNQIPQIDQLLISKNASAMTREESVHTTPPGKLQNLILRLNVVLCDANVTQIAFYCFRKVRTLIYHSKNQWGFHRFTSDWRFFEGIGKTARTYNQECLWKPHLLGNLQTRRGTGCALGLVVLVSQQCGWWHCGHDQI